MSSLSSILSSQITTNPLLETSGLTGLLSSSSGGVVGTSGLNADATQISQVGQFLNNLQTLQQTNPSEFKQLASNISNQLASAATQAGASSSQGAYLSQLASQFQSVANGAPLSTLFPQQQSAQSLAVQAYLQVQQSASSSLLDWIGGSSSDSSGSNNLLQSLFGGSDSTGTSNDLLSQLGSSSDSSGLLQSLLSSANGSESSSGDVLQTLLSGSNGNSMSDLLQSELSSGAGSSSSGLLQSLLSGSNASTSSSNDMSSLFQSIAQQAQQAVTSSVST